MERTNRRRKLTLDLNAASQAVAKKKTREHEIHANNCVLTSPDVQMLKLTSPQMREFITRNATLATPTPGFEFPRTMTEQQASYLNGFEKALEDIKAREISNSKQTDDDESNYPWIKQESHSSVSLPPLPPLTQAPMASLKGMRDAQRSSSGASGSLDSSFLNTNIAIKEETDDAVIERTEHTSSNKRARRKTSTSSNDDSISSIGYDSQDKLERKRQRNRLAASKCRKRKLERIAQLDTRVSELRGENNNLAVIVKNLKETVYKLKQEVLDHVSTGCRINMVEEPPLFSN